MIRFAIWAAVSTEAQALDDKESLPEQEKRCRLAAAARGWLEVGQPYVVPGESRTRWVNLRDAEAQIPPLHQMLEDAKAGLFDVLVIYDYNRLRDLLDPVAKTLGAYGVQLYSVNQAIEPLPPDQFSPYASDSESMMRGMSQVISRWQINDLRRKHTFGVMARVRRGLHPSGRAPFGYVLQAGILHVNAVEAAVAIQIKDLYLSGLGVPQIIDVLRQKRIRPPRGRGWSDYGVRYILRNPVYCGIVRLGYFRQTNDPRTGNRKQVRGDPSKILTGAGSHPALWDEATHRAILAEIQHRARRHKGPKTQRLSNLLYCADHGRPLRVKYQHDLRDDSHRIWYCRDAPGHWHLTVRDADMLPRLADQLADDLTTISTEIAQSGASEASAVEGPADFSLHARDDLLRRRARLVEALELGSLDPATYATRVEALDAQLASLEDQLSAADRSAADHQLRLDSLTALVEAIGASPDFLLRGPPQSVNQQLRTLIEKVAIVSDSDFEIHYR